jgi:hypothetical protein
MLGIKGDGARRNNAAGGGGDDSGFALRSALGLQDCEVRFFSGRGLFQVVTLHFAHTFGGGVFGNRCGHSYPQFSQR